MKLSIITINLNNKDGLKKTIESVVDQTFRDFEFLIIDGGSTDGSVELIKEYSNKIDYWVSEKDSGIYNAMNKGVKMAKGKYCNFMNSGDAFYSKLTLEKVFNKKYSSDIMIGKAKTESRIIHPPDSPTLLYFYNKKPINHQSAFIKRQLLLDFPYEESKYKIVSDYKFFFDAFIKGNCSYQPLEDIITNFDSYGIGSMNLKINYKEQEEILEEIHPRIIADYNMFHEFDNSFTKSLLPIITFQKKYGHFFNPMTYFLKFTKVLKLKK